MTTLNVTLSDNDEDFVSCQICLTNFDDKERVPKFLKGCYHYFCLVCIKELVDKKPARKLECPVCRVSSVFTKTKCEDLTTNQVALHLLNVVMGKAEAKKENEKRNNWCSDCAIPATSFCYEKKHLLQSYSDIHTSWLELLNSQKKQIQLACDQALGDYKTIDSIHHVIHFWIQFLQKEINCRETSTAAACAQIESFKISEEYPIHHEENMTSALRRFELLSAQLTARHKEAVNAQSKARNQLLAYGSIQPKSESSNNKTPGAAVQILPDWTKIFGSFSLDAVSNQTVRTTSQPSTNVLESFMSLLPEPGNVPGPSSSITIVTQETEKKNDLTEPLPSCSGIQTSKRSMQNLPGSGPPQCKRGRGRLRNYSSVATGKSLVTPSQNHASNSGEVEVLDLQVSFPRNAGHCFLEFLLGSKRTERVTIQIENTIAPVMSTKFLEYCASYSRPGYLGTRVFVVPAEPNKPHTLEQIPSMKGGRIIDDENLLFIADVSPLPAKLGSVLFIVKEVNDWGTLVSPEFQILLGVPNEDQAKKQTTVFGQIVCGLSNLCQLYNSQTTTGALKSVTIVNCGLTNNS